MKKTTRILSAGILASAVAVAGIAPVSAEARNNNRPTAQITSPTRLSAVSQDFSVNVNASGNIRYVEAFLVTPNGGFRSLGIDASSPYSFSIKGAELGKYQVYARSVDNNFKTSRYTSTQFYVEYANVVVAAVNTPSLSTLVAAVQAGGLVDALAAGNLTVLAPNNDAFTKLPAGTVETLVKPENKDALVKILTYHVLPGFVDLNKMANGTELTTLQGQKLTANRSGKTISLTTSTGQTINVIANLNDAVLNANAYVIDGVLLPQ